MRTTAALPTGKRSRGSTGWPEVDATGKTGVAGVWVVGQAAHPMQQVIGAAAAGSLAAAAVNMDLVEEEMVGLERAGQHGHAGGHGHAGHHRHGHSDPAGIDRLLSSERHTTLPPEQTLRSAGVARGQTVVDIGCGPGYFTLPAAGMVGPHGTVYAVDTQPEMVEACRRRVAEAGVRNVEVRLSSPAHVPLPDGIAGRVLISLVLHEADNPTALLREARRLLEPGGEVALVELREETGPPGAPRLSAKEVASAAAAAGLRVRRQQDLDGGHLLYHLCAG
jgi:2-polyprenyl-3-methyl-5-hydroxy-6-metoxy-1,4-benzoquinol methylase